MTFAQWCAEHSVTDGERERLWTYWIALRLRRCGILGILMQGR
jgi:hypothetical protein